MKQSKSLKFLNFLANTCMNLKTMTLQILCMYDSLDTIDVDKVVSYISGLQQEDGSFYGDKWGEVDTRFSFCAVACLALLVGLNLSSYRHRGDDLMNVNNDPVYPFV